MHFKKYQGTGNDFVMLDDRERVFPSNDIELIAQLCNRRFGIGADGLILLQYTADKQFYMKYFNSDGKESSMCGNGGRCFAQFIFDTGLAIDEVVFYAIDGKHLAKKDILLPEEAVIALQMISVDTVKELGTGTYELNTGSPHYVKFIEEPIAEMALVEEAKKIRYNPIYKEKGININYLNLIGLKEVRLRTYERGVEDETLSCGTGATAAALSTALFNQLPAGSHQIHLQVMGGQLKVKFTFYPNDQRFEDIWLIGSAKMVFSGEI
jgi:diaminopimelate epimerase